MRTDEHGKCGCNHDRELDITSPEQTAPSDAAPSCCGGHNGPETVDGERLEVERGA